MRIANQVPNYMPTPGNSRKNANSFTGQSFRSQVDLASTRHLDQCNFTAAPAGRWMDVSAYCKLMDSYRSWKDRQPPQELPGGQGPTKENIDYLKEHYSGSLSWEERVDALETMVQMGVITSDHRDEAMGCEKVTHITRCTLYDGTKQEPESERCRCSDDWNIFFSMDPIGSFKTSDDVFAWLGQVLDGEK